jgi:hypothetical protein
MKKFNYKNKREYLSKNRNSTGADAKKSNDSSSRKNLGSNWKNYEEETLTNLSDRETTSDNLNFDELLESSSRFWSLTYLILTFENRSSCLRPILGSFFKSKMV